MNREACERRVYRLAMLLLGDPGPATRVIEAVLDAQPQLDELDSAHIDRLTVLRSREHGARARPITHPIVADPVAAALASLPVQVREAWLLSRVYRLPDREVARSMDCSVNATIRHRDQADEAMRARLGDRTGAGVDALLRFSMSIDVPEIYRAKRRRRERWRVARWVVLAAVLLALGAVGVNVLRGLS